MRKTVLFLAIIFGIMSIFFGMIYGGFCVASILKRLQTARVTVSKIIGNVGSLACK